MELKSCSFSLFLVLFLTILLGLCPRLSFSISGFGEQTTLLSHFLATNFGRLFADFKLTSKLNFSVFIAGIVLQLFLISRTGNFSTFLTSMGVKTPVFFEFFIELTSPLLLRGILFPCLLSPTDVTTG